MPDKKDTGKHPPVLGFLTKDRFEKLLRKAAQPILKDRKDKKEPEKEAE